MFFWTARRPVQGVCGIAPGSSSPVASDSGLIVVGQVGRQAFAELLVAHALPVAPVEEPVLEPAEEPLGCRVVRAASLGAHRPDWPVLLADADPSGPPVVAAAVGMDDWTLPVPERGDRVGEHPIRHAGVRGARQRPGDDHPVEAVDHRGQPALAPVHGGPGDVRGPTACSSRRCGSPAPRGSPGPRRSPPHRSSTASDVSGTLAAVPPRA